MAKASKTNKKSKKLTTINNWEKATGHKIKNPKGKYDITVKTDLTPDELLKKMLSTSLKKNKTKNRRSKS